MLKKPKYIKDIARDVLEYIPQDMMEDKDIKEPIVYFRKAFDL